MVNFKSVLMGNALFLSSYFFLLIGQFIFPVIMVYLSSTLEGIMWIGIIICWFLAFLVMPVVFIFNGLKEDDDNDNNIVLVIAGIVWFILSMLLSYFIWYWNTTLYGMLTMDLLKVFYWIGILIIWVSNVIVIPSYLLIRARSGLN